MYEDVKKLDPVSVWKCFADLAKVPRPSGLREPVKEFLVSYGHSLGLETLTDKIGNVLIRKPASPGLENRVGVILQAHMDMVPQKDENKVFDFEKDPIEAHVEGDWVKADHTTLGADNGIGVAMAMAILADKTITHPPLEAFFTVDEETHMCGAVDLQPNWLHGKYLLNLDSETEGMLFIGCAGGIDANATLQVSYTKIENESQYQALQVTIEGCHGGHSGIDIILQRANAIKLLFRWLNMQKENLCLAEVKGGSLRNAIARSAQAIIIVKKDQYDNILQSLSETERLFKDEYKNIEDAIRLTATDAPFPKQILSKDSQQRLIDGVTVCPHGVYGMFNDLPGVVETSNNLSKIEPDKDMYTVTCLLRSNRESRKKELQEILRAAMHNCGWQVTFEGNYPGWQPNMDSRLLATMQDVYKKEFGSEPKILVIHAGLECGIIGSKYPNMEMISFGPTIEHPHSPSERVNITTVRNMYRYLLSALKTV